MKEIITAALAIPFVITMSLLGIRFTETLSEGWKDMAKQEIRVEHRAKIGTCTFVHTKDMQPGDYLQVCK